MSDSSETLEQYWKEAKSKAKAQIFVPFESHIKKLKVCVRMNRVGLNFQK